MSVTQIDVDDEALERAMPLSKARTKKETVNIALRFYVGQQERAARFSRHFDRARTWGAVEDDPGAGPYAARTGAESVSPRQEQYCASLPIDRYMQSAFSISCSTASRLREVSRSMTSSGG